MTEGPAALLEGLSSLSLATQMLAAALEESPGPGSGNPSTQPEKVSSNRTVTKSLAGYTDVRDGGIMYRFIGQQVCSRCGDVAHLASVCSVPQCSLCDRYGHRAGCCSEACSRCGRQHTVTKSKKCRAPECHNCKRFGHTAEYCPRAECMRCEYLGHMMSKCPIPAAPVVSYSSSNGVSVAEQLALKAVNSASDGGQSLTDSLLAGDDNSSSKAARKPIRQTSSSHASSTAHRLQLAAKFLALDVKQVPRFELRPPAATAQEQLDLSSKLMHALFVAQQSEYAMQLAADEQKLACLSRIAEDDLASVINHPTLGKILDAVYQEQLQEQQQEEFQRQLERQQQEEQQRQREQYEQRQQTLEHQRLREQRDRQERQQRFRQRQPVAYQRVQQHWQRPQQQQHSVHPGQQHSLHQGQQLAHPGQQQPPHSGQQLLPRPTQQLMPHLGQQQQACQRQQLLPHQAHQATPHSGQPQPPQRQQQSNQPRRPQHFEKPRLELNVLDACLPKGGKVGDVVVCLLCGGKGHQADKCKTPFCTVCCKYGHQDGTCKSVCLKCGWKHAPPLDDACKVPQCKKCGLWGHIDEDCPLPRCSHCEKYGHPTSECPKLAVPQQDARCQAAAPATAVGGVLGKVVQDRLQQSGLAGVQQSGLTTVGVMPYNPLAGQVVAPGKPEPPNVIF